MSQTSLEGLSDGSGSDSRPVLDSLALRHLAEKADGFRGRRLCLVWRPEAAARNESDPTGYIVVPATEVAASPSGPRDEVLIELETPFHDERRATLRFSKVVVEGPGIASEDVADKYDALFWSEAAVEKFMFGYYLRNLDDADWQRLYQAFVRPSKDTVIYAFGHLPDSTWIEISDGVPDSVHVFSNRGVHTVTEFLSFL